MRVVWCLLVLIGGSILVPNRAELATADTESPRVAQLQQHLERVSEEQADAVANGEFAGAEILQEVRQNIANTLAEVQAESPAGQTALELETLLQAEETASAADDEQPSAARERRPDHRPGRGARHDRHRPQSREEHLRAAIHHLQQAGMGHVAERIRIAARGGRDRQHGAPHEIHHALRRALHHGHERLREYEEKLEELERHMEEAMHEFEEHMEHLEEELEERFEEIYEHLEGLERAERRHGRRDRDAHRGDRKRLEETIRRFHELLDETHESSEHPQ